QSEGLIGSIMQLLAIRLPVPDHSTLSRRACGLSVQRRPRSGRGGLHLIVDSTGLKLRGAGEWLFEKHGTSKRRSWRKLHIGIDADSDEIVAFDLTDKEIDDDSHVGPLLEQVADAPASFMGDGAYDRAHVLYAVLARNPAVRFIVPPCKGAVLGSTARTAPTQRDLHIRSIKQHAYELAESIRLQSAFVGGEFFEHDPRRQSRRQRLQPLFQRDQQTIGQKRNENMGFDSGFELVIEGTDRQIVLQLLERLPAGAPRQPFPWSPP